MEQSYEEDYIFAAVTASMAIFMVRSTVFTTITKCMACLFLTTKTKNAFIMELN